MSELAYIYLLQDGEDKGTNVYKIGRTVQKGGDGRKLKRLQGYSKGTVPYNTWKVKEDNLNTIEKKIKEEFKESYRLVRGTEWFEGDVKQMKKDIDGIIEDIDKKYDTVIDNEYDYHENEMEIDNEIYDVFKTFKHDEAFGGKKKLIKITIKPNIIS